MSIVFCQTLVQIERDRVAKKAPKKPTVAKKGGDDKPRVAKKDTRDEPKIAKDKAEMEHRVAELLTLVGLDPADGAKYPHEFSGGQRQRICIARALSSMPEFLVCVEPTSALDVSLQAQILNLMRDLQDRLGLSYLFISHNLAVVRHICHRIMVLYLGRMCELADRDALYLDPKHPYTQALISAVPVPDPRRERVRQPILLAGDVPSPLDPPSGCRFRTRCPKFAKDLTEPEQQRCIDEEPALTDRGTGHPTACHYAETLSVL